MPKAPPHADFAERLQLICNEFGVPGGRQRTTTVAAHFGVARETARLWFAGQVMPELSRIIEIAEEYRCSLDWLAMGRGNMYSKDGRHRVGEETRAVYETLSAQERAVIAAMRGLTERRRAGLVALLAEH